MIRFTTVNVDGLEVTRQFNSADEMVEDWNREDGTTLPSLDDTLIKADVDGVKIEGETFADLASAVGLTE